MSTYDSVKYQGLKQLEEIQCKYELKLIWKEDLEMKTASYWFHTGEGLAVLEIWKIKKLFHRK